jgi:hypothetical protein
MANWIKESKETINSLPDDKENQEVKDSSKPERQKLKPKVLIGNKKSK